MICSMCLMTFRQLIPTTKEEDMAEKYTEAQARAIKKYQEGKAQIKITVTKEQAERFKKKAADKGTSLTQMIVEFLEKA